MEEKETVLTGKQEKEREERGSFDESASKWVGQVRSLGGQQPKVESDPFIRKMPARG